MKVRVLAFTLIAVILLIRLSNATLITGTVYDANLLPIKAIVSINTTPQQTEVADNGSFEFQVPAGTFNLTATARNHSVSAIVNVVSDGVFRSDLILFEIDDPSLELPSVSEEPGLNQSDIVGNGNTAQPKGQTPSPVEPWGLYAGVIVALAILGFIAYSYSKVSAEAKALTAAQKPATAKTAPKTIRPRAAPPSEKNLNDFQKQIVAELHKSEGRMNQKDLRKLLPWSEAKVSIELDLLEEQGLIKKIKKGRGNIIILTSK